MNGKIEARINITGRVQGVGFRPFIYRMAVKNGLLGHVINLGDAGVQIIVEGTEDSISRFLDDIRENAPEVSDIEDILHAFSPFRGRFDRFIIDKSKITGKVASGIYPPDIGICPECLRDMEDPKGSGTRTLSPLALGAVPGSRPSRPYPTTGRGRTCMTFPCVGTVKGTITTL